MGVGRQGLGMRDILCDGRDRSLCRQGWLPVDVSTSIEVSMVMC